MSSNRFECQGGSDVTRMLAVRKADRVVIVMNCPQEDLKRIEPHLLRFTAKKEERDRGGDKGSTEKIVRRLLGTSDKGYEVREGRICLPEVGVDFTRPQSWTLVEDPDVILLDSSGKTSILVGVEATDYPADLELYARMSEVQLREQGNGVASFEKKVIVINGRRGCELHYKARMEGEVSVLRHLLFPVKRGVFVFFTLVRPVASQVPPEFERLLKSIRWPKGD